MEIDAVCGMKVKKEKPGATALYNNKTYYFCSSGCKRHFEKEPEPFVQDGPKGMFWILGMLFKGIFSST